VFALPLTAAAQGVVPVDTIAEGRRLRDAQDYGAAASLMATYAESHPDDIGSARFAALMAYWSKDFTSASAIYAKALERQPNDAELRLEAAQFFGNAGQRRRARELIAPVVDSADRALATTRGAITLLGTLDYWDGNLVGARARFVAALRLDSANADARRQLREIELASASWIALGAAISHDDQPIDRAVPDAELGWFANPITPLRVRFASTRFSHDDASESVSIAEGSVSTFLASARLDVSVAAGILSRSFGERTDWTGKAALGFRLPRNLGLEGSYQRAPYNNTAASLTKAIIVQELAGTFRLRESRGWLAESSIRREAFDDDNSITTAVAWALAPIALRPHGQIQLGYGFVAQSAKQSRFVARPDAVNFPPGQAPTTVRGYYDPYYTPRNLRAHSVLAAAKLVPGARWSITGNAALGVSASDDAPVVFTTPGRPPDVDLARTYYRRSFTPWKIDGGLEGKVSDAVRLTLVADHSNGAFYAQTTVGFRVTYTFVAAARRRADRY
jgi:tetratricopeptide (TPR) repeat protein